MRRAVLYLVSLRVRDHCTVLSVAQDNVKYLGTLEKFLEPLYRGTPITLLDSLPALFNSLKMVYSVSR